MIWPVPLARVVDFGIARIVGSPTITGSSSLVGTPLYIAPEQALGRDVDHRADIYALGVMMYQMLTGTLPFFGKDPATLIRQHVSATPRLPSQARPGLRLPVEVENLVMRCLAKLPANRPSTMRDVVEVLSAFESLPAPDRLN